LKVFLRTLPAFWILV